MEIIEADKEYRDSALAWGCPPVKPYEKRKGTVKDVCEWIKRGYLSDEEIAELDAHDGEGLLIRNADRSLDTIVNHQRIIFTIKP